MSYRAEPKGSMKAYLRQRDAEDAAIERATITARYTRSVTWLEKYHARSRKTAFNWSPSITVTKPEETVSEEIHHEIEGAQAGEVDHGEGVGNAAGESNSSAGSGEPAAIAESRFAREGHTDFGDGDTKF